MFAIRVPPTTTKAVTQQSIGKQNDKMKITVARTILRIWDCAQHYCQTKQYCICIYTRITRACPYIKGQNL